MCRRLPPRESMNSVYPSGYHLLEKPLTISKSIRHKTGSIQLCYLEKNERKGVILEFLQYKHY